MKPINLDNILTANSSISREEVDQIRNTTKARRDLGVKPHGYRLAAPHERQQVRGGCDESTDPRTVRLSGQEIVLGNSKLSHDIS
jgi:hypothetical protein